MNDPNKFVKELETKNGFKLKGTGLIKFHLGYNLFRDDHDVLCMAPTKYIECLVSNQQQLFRFKPKFRVYCPLENGGHPELDTSELLDPDEVQKYQSIIGSSQWSVLLARFDIATGVMTLSSFRSAQRKLQFERAQRVLSYL